MKKTFRDLIFILLTPILCLGIFSQIFILHSPSAYAQSATFSVSPPEGSFRVGQKFSVAISVHSGGSPINAAEATLNFPQDLLTVTSLSKSGSIFSLWTVEPTSSSGGIITFAGGTPSPFSGPSGTLLTVNFKAKKQGEARVIFSGGRILAADGKGTDIFSGSSDGSYKITPPPVIPKPKAPVIPAPEVPEVPIIELPVKPEITPTEEVQPPVEIGPWKISRFYMPLIFVTLLILGVMGLTLLLRNVRK